MPSIDKVLFVVDRKDLDYQTMREYDRFEKGAANSNTSTRCSNGSSRIPTPGSSSPRSRSSPRSSIAANKGHAIFGGHVVIIFDECHRSQFGDMHTAITKAFKRYHLFGFTGTPIFAANAGSGGNPQLRTTEQAFGDKLHTYTIVDAITDKNVLPFRIDYVNTIKLPDDDRRQTGVRDRHREGPAGAASASARWSTTPSSTSTRRRNATEQLRPRRERGSAGSTPCSPPRRSRRPRPITASSSRPAGRTFRPDQRLKVGLIYSYAANEPKWTDYLDEEEFETDALVARRPRASSRPRSPTTTTMFGTSLRHLVRQVPELLQRPVPAAEEPRDRPGHRRQHVPHRVRRHHAQHPLGRQEPALPRAHPGLLAHQPDPQLGQDLRQHRQLPRSRDSRPTTPSRCSATRTPAGIVLLKPYADYYDEYAEKVAELLERFPLGQPIIGETAQKEFIALFGAILRLQNILTVVRRVRRQRDPHRPPGCRTTAASTSTSTRSSAASATPTKESINDDIVFEIELIKQVEINVDYILMLVDKYHAAHGDGEDKEIRADISRAVDASPTLRNKKDLIEDFVDTLSTPPRRWTSSGSSLSPPRIEAELDTIIVEEKLKPDETRAVRRTGLPRRSLACDRHRDHPGDAARFTVRTLRWSRRNQTASPGTPASLLRQILRAMGRRQWRRLTVLLDLPTADVSRRHLRRFVASGTRPSEPTGQGDAATSGRHLV